MHYLILIIDVDYSIYSFHTLQWPQQMQHLGIELLLIVEYEIYGNSVLVKLLNQSNIVFQKGHLYSN